MCVLDAAVAEALQVPRPQPRDMQPGVGFMVYGLRFMVDGLGVRCQG